MNNNTTYKDSPLGKIPSDWEVKRLENILKFNHGFAFESEFFCDEGPIVLTPGNFRLDGGLNLSNSNTKRYSGSFPESFKFHKDDLLIVMTDLTKECNLLGKPAIIDVDDLILHNQRIAKIVLTDNIVTKDYLFCFFLSNYYHGKVKETATGSTVRHTSNKSLYNIEIALPPLPEQTRIAEVLSAWDRAISNVQATIEQVELRNKWLMQELLSGKRRLKGFGVEWKEFKLGYFIEEYNEKPKIGNNYEVFTSAKTGLMKQTDYYGDNRITNREDADYNVLPPNYLTYRSRSDDGLFTFNKNTLGITGLISGYYPVFTIKNGDIDFILTYCNFYRQQLTKFSIGTSQLVLAINALKKASFKLPSHEEQTAIAQVLQAAANEVQVLRNKRDMLKEQKKGLMQVLLTGKKRLKTN